MVFLRIRISHFKKNVIRTVKKKLKVELYSLKAKSKIGFFEGEFKIDINIILL